MDHSMDQVYHITTRQLWQAALKIGRYHPPSLDLQGFIHCSSYDQVLRTADTFFPGQGELLVLVVDAQKLDGKLKWEPGVDRSGELFPHIYGELDLNAVTGVVEIKETVGHYLFSPPSVE